MDGLTINEAAETTGWSPRMLRYLESAGLIELAAHDPGYRIFGPGELQRLRTLRELLARFDCGSPTSPSPAAERRSGAARGRSTAGSRSARSARRRSPPATGSRWEQDKHERLLARPHHDTHGERRRMTVTETTPQQDYKVADLSLADFGRKEIRSPSTRCPA